jgi:hypothetical protein
LSLVAALAVCAFAGGAVAEVAPTRDYGTVQTWDERLPDLAAQCRRAVVVVESRSGTSGSQGSGVIVDPSGKVLTANHVVEGAESVLLKLWNGAYLPAEGYLGLNPETDWALLRVAGRELPHAPIGDYTEMRPGEKVLVISAPKGLEYTVSEGIISALRRLADIEIGYRSRLLRIGFTEECQLIQFSAPTAPGSSGGPVFNAKGEVIGLVVLRHPADNVYFATPANQALPHMATEKIIEFDAMDLSAIGGQKIDTGRNPSSVGRLDPVSAETHASVPGDRMPVVRLDHGRFVVPESVEVYDRDTGRELRGVDGPPAAGEYRSVSGGRVYFDAADWGRRLRVVYEYRVERVAMLPPVNTGHIPEITDMVSEKICAEFASRGYELVPEAEAEVAIHALGVRLLPDNKALGESLRPEMVRRLAAEIDARYILFTIVSNAGEVGVDVYFSALDGHTGEPAFTVRRKEGQHETWNFFSSRGKQRRHNLHQVVERIAADFLDAD